MAQGERIRILRKELNMTLEKFGEKLGVKKSAVSKIEKGENNLTDQNIKLICQEFNVSEKWLRTGEGDMFLKDDENGIDGFLKKKGATDIELELIKLYFELEPEIRQKVSEHFKKHLSTPHEETPSSSVPVREAEEEYIKSRLDTAANINSSASSITEEEIENNKNAG